MSSSLATSGVGDSESVPVQSSSNTTPELPIPLQQFSSGNCDANSVSVSALIKKASSSLGYQLKEKQEESIMEFVKGRDVFVSLPTGYGKSLCYILLPSIFDQLRKVTKKSIVLVVSPLIALMRDQIANVTAMGISATHISDKQATGATVRRAVKKGEYQIIFISPEALLATVEWRNMLSTDTYRENLMAFVIDEAHCIKKWFV